MEMVKYKKYLLQKHLQREIPESQSARNCNSVTFGNGFPPFCGDFPPFVGNSDKFEKWGISHLFPPWGKIPCMAYPPLIKQQGPVTDFWKLLLNQALGSHGIFGNCCLIKLGFRGSGWWLGMAWARISRRASRAGKASFP